MKKEFKATLETRISKKGNQYEVLVIKLTDKLEKLVFLEQAELELLRLSSNKMFIASLGVKTSTSIALIFSTRGSEFDVSKVN